MHPVLIRCVCAVCLLIGSRRWEPHRLYAEFHHNKLGPKKSIGAQEPSACRSFRNSTTLCKAKCRPPPALRQFGDREPPGRRHRPKSSCSARRATPNDTTKPSRKWASAFFYTGATASASFQQQTTTHLPARPLTVNRPNPGVQLSVIPAGEPVILSRRLIHAMPRQGSASTVTLIAPRPTDRSCQGHCIAGAMKSEGRSVRW